MKAKRIPQAVSEEFLAPYLSDRAVCSMEEYVQHGSTTTFQHCLSVMHTSCGLAQRLHLKINFENLALGALLHDFYLYDWHDDFYRHPKNGRPLHGFAHPSIACENAMVRFRISPEVQHIIRTHMWPLTWRNVPASREAVIVCLVDKLVSTAEAATGFFCGLRHLWGKNRRRMQPSFLERM